MPSIARSTAPGRPAQHVGGRPGHDITYLAASGALSFTGHWTGPPRRSGVLVADLAGAAYATIAILAALRDRDLTGQRSYLDVALTDAAIAYVPRVESKARRSRSTGLSDQRAVRDRERRACGHLGGRAEVLASFP